MCNNLRIFVIFLQIMVLYGLETPLEIIAVTPFDSVVTSAAASDIADDSAATGVVVDDSAVTDDIADDSAATGVVVDDNAGAYPIPRESSANLVHRRISHALDCLPPANHLSSLRVLTKSDSNPTHRQSSPSLASFISFGNSAIFGITRLPNLAKHLTQEEEGDPMHYPLALVPSQPVFINCSKVPANWRIVYSLSICSSVVVV